MYKTCLFLIAIIIIIFALFWFCRKNKINEPFTLKREYYDKINLHKERIFYNKYKDKSYLELGKIYEEGNSEIKPDAISAIKYYLLAIQEGVEEGLLNIGKIYMNGVHPHYLPDKVLAHKIFNINVPKSDNLHKWCQFYIKEINHLFYDNDTLPQHNEYYLLPTSILYDIQKAYKKLIDSKKSLIIYKTPALIMKKEIDLPEDYEETLMPEIDIVEFPRPEIRNDSQNVHSHTVQNVSKNIIDSIIATTPLQTKFDHNKDDLIRILVKMKEDAVKNNENFDIDISKVIKVTDSLNDNQHSKYNKSEKDVFNVIYSKIYDLKNANNREELFKSFAKSLESALEYDKVVCSTGKIVRMVSTLDAMDDSVPNLVPEWAINEEIANLAGKIREKIMNEASEQEKRAYDLLNPNENEKKLSENVSNKMKNELKNKCFNDYVKTGIMSEELMDLTLQEYLNNL
jgi:hypothetical protein